jgi:DnaJ-class molecular chaperone
MNPISTQDLYSRLGIERTATSDEVKKAFRRMAMQYHPDRNLQNPEQAHKDFIAVSEAYEVLSDPTKRARYDRSQTVDSYRTRHQPRSDTWTPPTPKHSRDEEEIFNFYNNFYKENFYKENFKNVINKDLEKIIIKENFYKFNKINGYYETLSKNR